MEGTLQSKMFQKCWNFLSDFISPDHSKKQKKTISYSNKQKYIIELDESEKIYIFLLKEVRNKLN